MKYLIAILFFIAGASEAETIIYAHTISHHVNRAADYNEANYGLGLRHYTTTGYVTTGTYHNSERNQSNYLGYGWEFNKYIGLSAGIITGYELGEVLPYLVPVIRYKRARLVIVAYPEATAHLTIDLGSF